MNRWETAALAAVSRWQTWASGTVLAFWRKEGKHRTDATRVEVNWNEEIIKTMVGDVQPVEEPFSTETGEIFQAFKDSTLESLSALPRRLGEFQGMDNFVATFPRRDRNLGYEIDKISNWFFEELQIIFLHLRRAHGASYIMQHMLPMYGEIDSGNGVTKRRIQRLELQVSGDRDQNIPKLFKFIRDSCNASLSNLLETTKEKLQEVVDKCSEDIRNDLEIVRGEDVPASDESEWTMEMFHVLERAQAKRDEVSREFEAGIV